MNLTAEEIIAILHLKPHPREGGAFVETYRSAEVLGPGSLPPTSEGSRSLATAIYYFITPQHISALHRLAGDEIFHFYLGDPVEMLQLHGDGHGDIITIGADLEQGMRPQVLVPRGVWQGARLKSGGRWALLGTTMAPGFDDRDYEPAEAGPLIAAYPAFRERILDLAR